MQNFKVGDWVRHQRLKTIHKVLAINCGEFDDKICVSNSPTFDQEFMNDYILWEPKVGEWVWSTGSYTQAFIFQWTLSHSQLGLKNYTNYEPFIGELPTYLKDNT